MTKLNICHHMLTSFTRLQKRSFHVIERTRTSSQCQKMKNARAKRAKILFFIVKYVGFLLPSSSWLLKFPLVVIVFAYQLWKPQFLSVVQFQFDNCPSPFSPTTFFEIGVFFCSCTIGKWPVLMVLGWHHFRLSVVWPYEKVIWDRKT